MAYFSTDRPKFCTSCRKSLIEREEVYPSTTYDAFTGEKDPDVVYPFLSCPDRHWSNDWQITTENGETRYFRSFR